MSNVLVLHVTACAMDRRALGPGPSTHPEDMGQVSHTPFPAGSTHTHCWSWQGHKKQLQHELIPAERAKGWGQGQDEMEVTWHAQAVEVEVAWAEQGHPCPIPDSQHTSSLLWLDGRKHLPRLKQVRLVQNYTIKKLAPDEFPDPQDFVWPLPAKGQLQF